MKKVVVFCLCWMSVILLLLLPSGAQDAEATGTFELYEPYASATEIQVNRMYENCVSDGEEQWYCFTLPGDGTYQVEISHDDMADESIQWLVGMCYYDGIFMHDLMGGANHVITGDNSGGSLTWEPVEQPSGTYYLRVTGRSYTALQNYQITVRYWESAVPNEAEPNDTMEQAMILQAGEEAVSRLDTWDDRDWYRIDVPEQALLDIALEHWWGTSVQIELCDANGEMILSKNDEGGMHGDFGKVFSAGIGVQAGSYYICLSGHHGNDYRLRIAVTPMNHGEIEPNGTAATATDVQSGVTYTGALSTQNEEDWYRFSFPIDFALQLTFAHEPSNIREEVWTFRIYIYESDGTTYADDVRNGAYVVTETSDRTFPRLVLPAGEYYIRIIVGDTEFSSMPYHLTATAVHTCEASGIYAVTQRPTCTAPGREESTCIHCGNVAGGRDIPALTHMTGDWIVDREATCTTDGERHGTCIFCGEAMIETIAKHAHAYGEWQNDQDPTCFTEGNRIRSCTLCGAEQSQNIPTTGHTYGEWTVAKGNKVIPPIVRQKVCTACGDTQSATDWSYSWILGAIVLALVAIAVGVLNYAQAFRRK